MRTLLLLLAILAAVAFSGLVVHKTAYAVDVFNICSSDNQNPASDCVDCGSAAAPTDVCQDVNTQAKTNTNPIISDLKIAINLISFATGTASVIVIILSGLKFVTSGGDSSGISQARSGILYALVGIAVTVIAQSVVLFILDRLQ
jgi:hypothetical protein